MKAFFRAICVLRSCGLKILLLLVASLFPCTMEARVYSLRPGRGVAHVEELLSTKTVLTDVVKVNGAKGKLNVSISDRAMVKIMQDLQPILANYEHRRGQAAVLIDIPAGNRLRRYLIMTTEEATKTLVFRIDIPRAGLADVPAKYWPANLPQPAGIRVEQVMDMMKRQALYATFTSRVRPAELITRYHSQLLAAGWRRITKSDSGASYLRKETGQMLMVSVAAGKTRTHGSIFLRAVHPR